ncbi:MAG: CDP-diacylglycerol--serine O-phosphatidyltransferase [Candidatus Aminicenantes bacterium]|nr:CDP-diacylglycerol--serine O-phosphatidyltransferase [Candidatus Aminicenantes bacterium]
MNKKRIRRVSLSRLTRFSFLPSLFSLLSLFAGFLAVFQVFKGDFVKAIYLIMASAVLDGLDGTVARLTKTESNFGVQLDSLVDAMAFGVSTSFLIYKWGFTPEFHQFGKVIAFIFLSAGIIRLARFNVIKEADVVPSDIFIGLPIPIGAISIASIVLYFKDPITSPLWVMVFSLFVILISFLMISNVKYKTLKKVNSKVGLKLLFLFAITIALLIMFPDKILPLISILYCTSPIVFLILKLIRKRTKKISLKLKQGSETEK